MTDFGAFLIAAAIAWAGLFIWCGLEPIGQAYCHDTGGTWDKRQLASACHH